jgi:sulfate/thiosulfate transport system permease protein
MINNRSRQQPKWIPTLLIAIAIAYIALVFYIPTANVFYQAFHKGFDPFLQNLTRPSFLFAVQLTVTLTAIAVPLNVIFGLCAAWTVTRRSFPGKALVLSIIDLPFSISPVVVGLMLVLLYGKQSWLGGWLDVKTNISINQRYTSSGSNSQSNIKLPTTIKRSI